jgi:hypothetical protein
VPLAAASWSAHSAAQAASDYKALVCVFLFGGVDGNSLLIPNDTSGYARYAGVRPASSNLNIAQGELLPIQPTGLSAYGLHPQLAEIQPLFAQKRLAWVANVGTLNRPTDKASYRSNRPRQPVLALGPAGPAAVRGLVRTERDRLGRAHRRPARGAGGILPRGHLGCRGQPVHQRSGLEPARATRLRRPRPAGLQRERRPPTRDWRRCRPCSPPTARMRT